MTQFAILRRRRLPPRPPSPCEQPAAQSCCRTSSSISWLTKERQSSTRAVSRACELLSRFLCTNCAICYELRFRAEYTRNKSTCGGVGCGRHFCASQPLHVPLASRWPGSSPFEAAPSTSSTSFWVASITVGTRSRSPCRHTERRHGPGTAPSNPSARRIVTTRVSLSRRPLTCSRCVLGYAAETDARRSRRRFSTEKHCWRQKVAPASP